MRQMQDRSETFILYANCLPVKGARRSAIFDVQRGRIRFIPNALYELLVNPHVADCTGPSTRMDTGYKDEERIAEYYDVLSTEGYGMWTDEPERFPPLSLDWRRPEAITNAVIDVDHTSRHDWMKIRAELDEASCLATELRFYDPTSLQELSSIMAMLAGGKLRHVSLILAYGSDTNKEGLEDLCAKWPLISSLWIHSSPSFEYVRLPTDASITYTQHRLKLDSCGHVSMDKMAVNLIHFTEAKKSNSCLNRKVGIATDGQIGSCPACSNKCQPSSKSLKALVETFSLQQLTKVTKDEVKVCRDCEFRYVCTDCRVFVSDPSDPYSKPAHCTYDPYTATWRD